MAAKKTAVDPVEKLAKRMWQAYIRAQSPEDRSGYSEWDGLVTRDPDTQRGFRGVARMVIQDGKRRSTFKGVTAPKGTFSK
jgi:hypothetical protein